jgi:hypothetical protein
MIAPVRVRLARLSGVVRKIFAAIGAVKELGIKSLKSSRSLFMFSLAFTIGSFDDLTV